MKTQIPSSRGFTLIEMLVVLAIIILLTSLIVPAVNTSLQNARQTQCMSRLRNFGIAWNTYNLDILSGPHESEMDGVFDWISEMHPDYIQDPKLFICPADKSRGQYGSKPVENNSWATALLRVGQNDNEDFPETNDLSNNPEVTRNSYMYEFSDTPCTWWQGYVLNSEGNASSSDDFDSFDIDGDGSVSWGETKLKQLANGDTSQLGDPKTGYDRSFFPLIRCFHHYQSKSVRIRNLENPNNPIIQRSVPVLNVSVNGNVFVSGLQWEYPVVP